MNEMYLVLEYESGIVYIPFKDLRYVDEFTVRFDNPLELCAAINDYLNLGKTREEMLDAYLSESLDEVNNDNQEYDKRYLAVKYTRDNYNNQDLSIQFAKYLSRNLYKDTKDFSGLNIATKNYLEKYCKDRAVVDYDITKMTNNYLGNNYKRRKEAFFKLKDLGYKTKINENVIDYSKTSVKEMIAEDKMLLVLLTNMSLEELKDYTHKQIKKGKKK